MELPRWTGLTSKEASATVAFSERDHPGKYLGFTKDSFHDILEFAHICAPSIDGKISLNVITEEDELVNVLNWDETMQGYNNWGIVTNHAPGVIGFMIAHIKRDEPKLKYALDEQF